MSCACLSTHCAPRPTLTAARLTQFGYTALVYAARGGFTEVARLLLGRGADVEGVRRPPGLLPSAAGALSAAAEAALPAVFGKAANAWTRVLGPRAAPTGNTPLLSAAESGSLDCVLLLLDNGARVEARNAVRARATHVLVTPRGR